MLKELNNNSVNKTQLSGNLLLLFIKEHCPLIWKIKQKQNKKTLIGIFFEIDSKMII